MDEQLKIEKLRKAGKGPEPSNQHANLTHLKRRAGLGDRRGELGWVQGTNPETAISYIIYLRFLR